MSRLILWSKPHHAAVCLKNILSRLDASAKDKHHEIKMNEAVNKIKDMLFNSKYSLLPFLRHIGQ